MGHDGYPSVYGKAGALLHSPAKNHSLVDGNGRLACLLTVVPCFTTGSLSMLQPMTRYHFVIAVADGRRMSGLRCRPTSRLQVACEMTGSGYCDIDPDLSALRVREAEATI